MHHSCSDRVQAIFRLAVKREVSVYVNCAPDPFPYSSVHIVLIGRMLMINAFLSLIVVVANRVSHGRYYYLALSHQPGDQGIVLEV